MCLKSLEALKSQANAVFIQRGSLSVPRFPVQGLPQTGGSPSLEDQGANLAHGNLVPKPDYSHSSIPGVPFTHSTFLHSKYFVLLVIASYKLLKLRFDPIYHASVDDQLKICYC